MGHCQDKFGNFWSEEKCCFRLKTSLTLPDIFSLPKPCLPKVALNILSEYEMTNHFQNFLYNNFYNKSYFINLNKRIILISEIQHYINFKVFSSFQLHPHASRVATTREIHLWRTVVKFNLNNKKKGLLFLTTISMDPLHSFRTHNKNMRPQS